MKDESCVFDGVEKGCGVCQVRISGGLLKGLKVIWSLRSSWEVFCFFFFVVFVIAFAFCDVLY